MQEAGTKHEAAAGTAQHPDWAQLIRARLAGSTPRHDREDWLIPGRFEPGGERPTLEPVARGAVPVLDRVTQRGHALAAVAGDRGGPVGRIVEYLNLDALARVVDLRYRFHEPLNHIHLIKERQLDGNVRQNVFRKLVFGARWKARPCSRVPRRSSRRPPVRPRR